MPEANRMEPAQTGLDRKQRERETSLISIFLIVCLRYSGILNPRFLHLGPFFLVGGTIWFFSVLGFGERDLGDWTGPDGLMKEG